MATASILVAASADEESVSDFVPAGFPAATEALREFYFGNARAKDTLVAETQVAWIAAKQISLGPPAGGLKGRCCGRSVASATTERDQLRGNLRGGALFQRHRLGRPPRP